MFARWHVCSLVLLTVAACDTAPRRGAPSPSAVSGRDAAVVAGDSAAESDATTDLDGARTADAAALDAGGGADVVLVFDASTGADARAGSDAAATLDAASVDGALSTDAAGTDAASPDSGIPACNTHNFYYYEPGASVVRLTGTLSTPMWNTMSLPMLYVGSGLFVAPDVLVPTGQHRYKFIVDGRILWEVDQFNPLREPDGQTGFNSILGAWHTFAMMPPVDAVEVRLVGSFTRVPWSVPDAAPLAPLAAGSAWWGVTLELPPGRHSYKFVAIAADGTLTWLSDPLEPEYEPDGAGGNNSVRYACTR